MLRHILQDLERAVAFVILTLILFLIIANLSIQSAIALRTLPQEIATITETETPSGQLHCRSEQVLIDETGHKWQLMLFTQTSSPPLASLNLRLSGLSSELEIESTEPLVISTAVGSTWQAADLLAQTAPLPTIAQYDLTNIITELPIESINLELPIVSKPSIKLVVPEAVVKEWQELAKQFSIDRQLPSGFPLAC